MIIHQNQARRSLVALVVTGLMLSACSESPTDPAGEPGGGGGTGFVDAPDVPEPDSPGGDVPNRSEVRTRIEPLDGNFRARVMDVSGTWRLEQTCGVTTRTLDQSQGFASAKVGAGYRDLARSLMGPIRDLIDANGDALVLRRDDRNTIDCGGGPFIPAGYENAYFQSRQFDAEVYVRRDRHWALRPLEGGAGDYLLVYPNTQGEVSSSYQSGSEQSRTEEFGRSITATVGASWGALSASVSATLSETFSSSVSVSESTTETFTKTVTGKDDTVIQFMVWELVEEYSFCNADGEPITSDFFRIETGSMERRGVAIALKSTEFPLK